jgi:hypothetical protein
VNVNVSAGGWGGYGGWGGWGLPWTLSNWWPTSHNHYYSTTSVYNTPLVVQPSTGPTTTTLNVQGLVPVIAPASNTSSQNNATQNNKNSSD